MAKSGKSPKSSPADATQRASQVEAVRWRLPNEPKLIGAFFGDLTASYRYNDPGFRRIEIADGVEFDYTEAVNQAINKASEFGDRLDPEVLAKIMAYVVRRIRLDSLLHQMGLHEASADPWKRFTLDDLLNANGWERSRIQRAFMQTLLGMPPTRKVKQSIKLLREIIDWEIGGTDFSRPRDSIRATELGYCPFATHQSMRRCLRRDPTIVWRTPLGQELLVRFYTRESAWKDQKANDEWDGFWSWSIALMSDLADAEIEYITSRRTGNRYHVSAIFRAQNRRLLLDVVWAIVSDMRRAGSGVWRGHLRRWLQIVARVRTAKKDLRDSGYSCYPPVPMKLDEFMDSNHSPDRAAEPIFNHAAKTIAVMAGGIKPRMDESHVAVFERALRSAQNNPPKDFSDIELLVDSANFIMSSCSLRIAVDGDDRLYRLRIQNQSGVTRIRLKESTTGSSSRKFESADNLRIVRSTGGPGREGVIRQDMSPKC